MISMVLDVIWGMSANSRGIKNARLPFGANQLVAETCATLMGHYAEPPLVINATKVSQSFGWHDFRRVA